MSGNQSPKQWEYKNLHSSQVLESCQRRYVLSKKNNYLTQQIGEIYAKIRELGVWHTFPIIDIFLTKFRYALKIELVKCVEKLNSLCSFDWHCAGFNADG